MLVKKIANSWGPPYVFSAVDSAFDGAQSHSVKFLNCVNHVNSVTDLSACPLPPNELNFLIS